MEAKVQTVANKDIFTLIEKRRNTYLNEPLSIVEHFNNENKNIDEYNGRQLLEMIQNANDECETLKAKKVLIKLEDNTLIIANNGNPFSLGGVESLMYSDLSPKVMEENKIGQKGLGFRSVLNWSTEIYIASYDLHLKFSKQHAIDFLEEIISEKPEIKEILKSKTKKDYPVSVLRCPYIEENTSLKKEISYDTVIELSLKSGIQNDIKKQIDTEIIPEILIFLNKIEEIEVVTDTHHYLLKKEVCGNKILISKKDYLSSQNDNEWDWYILEEKGKLSNVEGSKNYEIKIAYNPDYTPKIQNLFSYFRTEVDFPYPVLAHGSFELSSNRNHLLDVENGFNKQLLDKLAKLLVECALMLTNQKKCNYNALRLVIPTKLNNSSLNKQPWNFNKSIELNIQRIAIFPSIKNKYLKLADNIKFYKEPIQNYIPKKAYPLFENLLQSTTDNGIVNYILSLSNDLKYKESEFTNKINKIIDNSLFTEKQITEWIYILCEKTTEFYSSRNPILPNLLTSSEDKIIDRSDIVIVPPKEVSYNLPKGIKLQFLNKDLFRRIRYRFGNPTPRQVIEKLRLYNVSEYAMNVVVQKIISSTNEIIKKGKRNKSNVIAEMHKALYGIYITLDENSEARKSYPTTLTSPYLVTRNNELKEANRLYFGNEYALGFLMEDLLKEVKQDVFVGSLEQNGLAYSHQDSKINHIKHSYENYFKWLGVEDLPKQTTKEIKSWHYNENEFIKYIFKTIRYPFATVDFNERIEDIDEMKSCWDFKCEVLWYEYFDEIIKGGSFEYLLTWFLKDSVLYNSLINNQEYNGTYFRFSYPRKQYYRNLPKNLIKSYIYYQLQKTDFIPIESGLKSIPNNCLLDSNNLSPLVKTPKINYTASAFKNYFIDEEQINYFLKRIGVKDSLKDLSILSIYSLLNQHHIHFAEATSNIQNFYLATLESTKNKEVIDENIERKKYFRTGQIFAFFEGESKFYPINEVTYVDNPNFSQEILKKLKIAKLPSRSGNQRVLNIFGVQPLDYIKFYVQKNIESNNKLNEAFVSELNEMKPYLFTYRHQKGLKKTQLDVELSAIKNIKICLVYSLVVEYKLNEIDNNLSLHKYEYIQDENSKIYYIKLNREDLNYYELKRDFRFKETVADIICGALKVTENRKDFMLLLGESPSNWIHLLKREFDNYETIEKDIAAKFEGVLTSEQRFWKALLELKTPKIKSELEINIDFIHKSLFSKMPYDDFFNIYREIDYANLTNNKNFTLIEVLFRTLKIDISDFNALGYKILNFQSYLENQLYTYHKDFSEKYASYLYDKKTYVGFIENCELISDFRIFRVNNTVYLDVQKLHKSTLLKNFKDLDYQAVSASKKIDLVSIYNRNLKALESDLRLHIDFNDSIFNDMKYDSIFKNAVYFNRVEDIKNELIQKFQEAVNNKEESQINIGETSVSFSNNNVNELLKLIEDKVKNGSYAIEHYDPTKIPESSKISNNGASGGQSFNGKSKKIKNEDIGFIGEKFAYEILKQEYESVEWVSEYAIKAGYSNGKDGLGYDFECKKGGETRFVEVKSSVTKNYAFIISTKEVKIGHLKEKTFDILLITNLLSDDINFKYLKNIFDYKTNESFLDNSKFLVENDSYKIKFK